MRRVLPLSFPENPLIAQATDLGAYVRAARTQSGLTLEEAALSVGVSRQTMVNIEKNSGSVSFAVILQAARALGVVLFAQPAESREHISRLLQAEVENGA